MGCSESAPDANGHITLDAKQAGKRSAGNPHAAFDEAGAGNVTRGAGLRTNAKAVGIATGPYRRRASPRPYQHAGAHRRGVPAFAGRQVREHLAGGLRGKREYVLPGRRPEERGQRTVEADRPDIHQGCEPARGCRHPDVHRGGPAGGQDGGRPLAIGPRGGGRASAGRVTPGGSGRRVRLRPSFPAGRRGGADRYRTVGDRPTDPRQCGRTSHPGGGAGRCCCRTWPTYCCTWRDFEAGAGGGTLDLVEHLHAAMAGRRGRSRTPGLQPQIQCQVFRSTFLAHAPSTVRRSVPGAGRAPTDDPAHRLRLWSCRRRLLGRLGGATEAASSIACSMGRVCTRAPRCCCRRRVHQRRFARNRKGEPAQVSTSGRSGSPGTSPTEISSVR